MFGPPVVLVARPGQEPALLEPPHRAADLGLVGARPFPDLLGRHAPVLAQMKQHPPVGTQHPVAPLVDLLERQAAGLGGLRQQVWQETLQIEVIFFAHLVALAVVSYKINY